jgi:hypothetical protein
MTTATSAAALNLFIPITKIDVAKRLVYGIATAEKADRSGEVCDYATTKPYYEKWSSDFHKASGGKSLGNLRAMHGKVAAGKVTTINFNDEAKQIEICSKVVDDNEWNKVEQGIYTGFSQGGSYVKRWKDGEVQKYTADPNEISLVDLPCLADATFEIIKADGASELRKFVSVEPEIVPPTNDQIAARATEMAKAAGDETKWIDHLEAASAELLKAAKPAPAVEQIAAAAAVVEKAVPVAAPAAAAPADGEEWDQVWKSRRDASTFNTKAELRKYHEQLDAAAATAATVDPVQKSLDEINAALGIEKKDNAAKPGKTDASGKAAAASADEGVDPVTGKKKKKAKKFADADALKKGLYDVGRFADLITQLNWLANDAMSERAWEGDNSTVPDQIKAGVAVLCAAIRTMVIEETTELFDPENENDALLITVLEMAAGVPAEAMAALVKFAQGDEALAKCRDAIEKAGARHSKADQTRIQDAHDNLVAAGADCGMDKGKKTDDLEKAADDLSKATARGDALQKALDNITPQLEEITKRLKHIESQPAPHPLTRVISKSQDGGGDAEVNIEEAVKKMTPDQLSVMLIKIAQQQGRPLLDRGR